MNASQTKTSPLPRLRLRVDEIASGDLDRCMHFIRPCESLRRACSAALHWLFTPDDIPSPMPRLTLLISSSGMYDGEFVGQSGAFDDEDDFDDRTVVFNIEYLCQLVQENRYDEFIGVLVHEVSLCLIDHGAWGLKTGLADYVRLREGLAPVHWERRVDGSWSQGYDKTAYFLDFLEKNKGEETVRSIVTWLRNDEFIDSAHLDDHIGQIVGVNVAEAWDEYRDSLGDYSDSDEETETQSIGDEDNTDEDAALSMSKWPIPEFRLSIKDLSHNGAKIFQSTTDAHEVLKEAVMASFLHLYTPENVPRDVKRITLILRPMDGVAYTIGRKKHKEIHFSLEYIESQKYRAQEEIAGVLVREVVHCYQYGLDVAPSGLTEGIADFVRLRAGFAPNNWCRIASGKWDTGYDTTAYFLDWIDKKYGDDTIRKLNNQLHSDSFSDNVFSDLTGCSVGELWTEYGVELQAKQVENPDLSHPDDELEYVA